MDRIAVGYVARAHGVRGEVRVHTHDPASTVLLGLERIFVDGRERRVLGARATTGGILLVLEGVSDRDGAEALAGTAVEVPREAIPVAAGEVLLADLIGAEVVDEAGAALGRATAYVPGAQGLLVLRDGDLERLLPLVPEFVRSFDPATRRLVVSPPEDLPVERVGPPRRGR